MAVVEASTAGESMAKEGAIAEGTSDIPPGTLGFRSPLLKWYVRASAVVAPLATVVGLVLGVRELFDLEGPGWAVVLALFNALLVLLAVAAVYAEQYRHRREVTDLHRGYNRRLEQDRRNAAVAVALPTIHDAYHFLRDAAVMITAGDSDVAVNPVLIKSLDHMASAFSSITGAPRRMCVKEMRAAPDTPDTVNSEADVRFFDVVTLYRHDGSVDPVKDGPSPLHENSDFKLVWDPEQAKRCFFSNDLDAHPGYVNPHRQGDPKDYDYNAAMIWPIQKRKGLERVGLLGFLCLDSKHKDLFQYENDFYLGAAYADSLYTVLALRPVAAGAPTAAPSG